MSIRHLDSLFDPQSVAVIGATERPASVGATVWRNLRDGGFAGARWAVNPHRATLFDEPCFPNVAALPGAALSTRHGVAPAPRPPSARPERHR